MHMADKSTERVLVVPTPVFHDLGLFQGFRPAAEDLLPRLLDPRHVSYQPRSEMETDPSFKQIIPYVVLRWQDQLFHYTRGKRATETRLQALRSIGVGGHISADDSSLFENPYREAMFREVAEEIHLDSPYREHCIGLINDDATPVGQVHLGVVHIFELEAPNVRRKEQVLTRAGFAPLGELRGQREEFETWSQFLLDHLGGPASTPRAATMETFSPRRPPSATIYVI
jgi:predicted NUDIX family phosphoesterase